MHDPTLLINILRDDTMAEPAKHIHKIIASLPVACAPAPNTSCSVEGCECGAVRLVVMRAGQRTRGEWIPA